MNAILYYPKKLRNLLNWQLQLLEQVIPDFYQNNLYNEYVESLFFSFLPVTIIKNKCLTDMTDNNGNDVPIEFYLYQW